MNILYWLIIGIVIAEFAYDLLLNILNIKVSKNPIPAVLSGLYDDEKYKKQQAYFRDNKKISFISSTLGTIITLGFFAFGGFAWLDDYVRTISDNEIIKTLLFFGTIGFISWLISLPIDIYDTFVIEERYGFNKTTPKTYILDTLKGGLLTILFGGGILSLVVWIYSIIPEWFWLIAWATISIVTIFIQYFYSTLIVPLFNKQTPLEAGELRDAIEAFAHKAGFKLNNIYVIDGSKRTTHSNAYFTGFGSKKRVVLYDTLIEQLNTDEIVGVLAHEIGHYKHHHIIKGLITGLITSLITLYLFSLIINNPTIAQAAGCDSPSFYVNLSVFSFIYSPLNIVLGIIGNIASRRNERQADAFAKKYGMGKAQSSALKKISAQSLSNLTPHPFVVFTEYSHPTLAQRVTMLEE